MLKTIIIVPYIMWLYVHIYMFKMKRGNMQKSFGNPPIHKGSFLRKNLNIEIFKLRYT